MIDPGQDALIRSHADEKPQRDPEEVRRRGEEALKYLEQLDWEPFGVEW